MKNAMFQFATNQGIFKDTDLITLDNAVQLFEVNKSRFLSELKEGTNPQMCIWINCKDNKSYGKTFRYWCADNFTVVGKDLYQCVYKDKK